MPLKRGNQSRLEMPKSCSAYCNSSAKLLCRREGRQRQSCGNKSESEERGDSATLSCLLISFKGKERLGRDREYVQVLWNLEYSRKFYISEMGGVPGNLKNTEKNLG